MRLIDADAFLERNKSSIYDTTDLEEMLYYEPTAYDVNKVLEQLQFLQESGLPMRSAINFVKEGGYLMDLEKLKKTFDELDITYSYEEKDFFGYQTIFLHGTNVTFNFDQSGKYITMDIDY